jgi:16S rRNA (cytosine1402-N4)-methyltransferase
MGLASAHAPVLPAEVLTYLLGDRSGRYVDLTVGGGGHAESILTALAPSGTLIGVDRDPAAAAMAAARLASFGGRAEVVTGRGSDLTAILAVRGIEQVDGVLLDLGLSSDQLRAERGFSFEGDCVLDLRFDPGEDRPTAADLLAGLDAGAIAAVLTRFGEFPPAAARRIARQLVLARAGSPLASVARLRSALEPVLDPRRRAQWLARVFQALRIAVNDELTEVEGSLEAATRALRPGGVLCVISYHSLEDRLVKRLFAPPLPPRRDLPPPPGWAAPRYVPLTRRAVRPTPEEIRMNPRSRSARLRAGQRRDG